MGELLREERVPPVTLLIAKSLGQLSRSPRLQHQLHQLRSEPDVPDGRVGLGQYRSSKPASSEARLGPGERTIATNRQAGPQKSFGRQPIMRHGRIS